MKTDVIFLAAGRGIRMGQLTEALPKPLIPVLDGRSILEADLCNLQASDLEARVTIVGGYCWTDIEKFCASAPAGLSPNAVFNSDFADAGAVRSIRAALRGIDADADAIAVANGDTVYSAPLFTALARRGPGLTLVVSSEEAMLADDMVVVLDGAGAVAAAEKNDSGIADGLLSAGLVFARGRPAVAQLDAAVAALAAEEDAGTDKLPWHGILRHLYRARAGVTMLEVDRAEWREFDSEECIRLYAKHVSVAR